MHYGSYLVCKEHVEEVKGFLGQFFEQIENDYTHDEWVSFKVPNSSFTVNLMRGNDQNITQGMTFEVYCNSLEELQKLALQNDAKIENLVATKTATKYRYHYIELFGPVNICKVEINYIEHL